jgi:hypothetical protein
MSNTLFTVTKTLFSYGGVGSYHCCICNKKLIQPFYYNSILHDLPTKSGWTCISEKCVQMFIFQHI